MSNRHQICAALIAVSSLSYAQEAATPAAGTAGEGGAASSVQVATVSTTGTSAAPVVNDESEGFQLPGGMGYTPLNFTPGQGTFNRPQLQLSTMAQVGYDDNIYSSHNQEKGSAITTLLQGFDLLLSQSRFALSTQANVGGQYYWDRNGDQLTPNGSLNLISGYKISPRTQLTGVVNAAYTNQATSNTVNGVVQSRGQEYFLVNSKFDLLYNWTPRLSSDTSYAISGIYYKDGGEGNNNSTTQTIGESMRYQFSRLVTGVAEGRASQVEYNSSTTNDADLYYALVGADVTLSRRLSASGRVGATIRDEDGGGSTSSMPYAEGNVNYALTRTSQVSANVRYGYNDNGSTGQNSNKSVRAGVAYSRSITAHLRANLSLNGNFVEGSEFSPRQDTVSGAAGLTYDMSKYLSLFATYNNVRVLSSDDQLEYTKNVYYLGATYSY